MSGATSVPQISFTANGIVVPADSAILAGVQADTSAAFGGNLNPALNTPQGQLASSETAIIGNGYAQQVALFNGVDPAYASGRMQDGIGRIYFLTRNPAQSTVLQIACGGGTNVPIPVGALIKDDAGNIIACTQAGTIPAGGSVTLSFAYVTTGPIAVPVTNGVSIYQSIPGWDSATVVSGVVGNAVESRAAFEARRQASVAGNSLGSIGSILGAVVKVPGVLDFYGYDNGTNAPVTIGGQTITANSIYICVAGGAAAAVAQAILSKKGPGCSYTGNTTVTAYDNNPLYSSPVPYQVSYQTPTALPILFAVTLKNSTAVPSTALTQIQAAISAAFSGTDGGPRARIGSTIFASRFYAGVASLGSWAQIVSILIGSPNAPAASFTGSIAGNALTVSAVASGALVIGQTVIGPSVIVGTTITSGSGTSWTVSVNQTFSSRSLTAVVPALNDLTVQVNQVPTLDINDISLTLV